MTMENTGEVAAQAHEFLDQETIRERVRCAAELLERPAPLAQNKSAAWSPSRNCGWQRGRFR